MQRPPRDVAGAPHRVAAGSTEAEVATGSVPEARAGAPVCTSGDPEKQRDQHAWILRPGCCWPQGDTGRFLGFFHAARSPTWEGPEPQQRTEDKRAKVCHMAPGSAAPTTHSSGGHAARSRSLREARGGLARGSEAPEARPAWVRLTLTLAPQETFWSPRTHALLEVSLITRDPPKRNEAV